MPRKKRWRYCLMSKKKSEWGINLTHFFLESYPGFEPEPRVLQTRVLPLY